MKTRSINLLTILVAICFMTSCRTAGLYTSNPKGRGAFAGNEFHLMKNDSFKIIRWTDSYTVHSDGNGNQIFPSDDRYRGMGTYQCEGDSLALTFSNEDSITVKLDIERSKDSVHLTFKTYNELGNIFYPNATILDEDGTRIDGTVVQLEDVFHFSIDEEEKPAIIKLDGFGLNVENKEFDISEMQSGEYTLKRKSYNGYFRKGQVKKIWFKRVPTGIRYQMHDKKVYLPKKWAWSWINKLYRDY